MPQIKLAIDGCGDLCRRTILPHLALADARSCSKVVAVCDAVGDRARAVAERFDVPQWYGDYTGMLAAEDIDAVLVVVPAALHAAHAIEAVRSGRHVYVQKPIATDVRDARALIAEAKTHGVKIVAAPGQILWPLFTRLRERIQEGAIGQPFFAQPPMLGWGGEKVSFPTNPAWFFGPDCGPLRDHGGYAIHTLTTLFGPVRRVSAFAGVAARTREWNGQKFEVARHDNAAVLLDFGGSLFALIADAWCATSPAASILRVHGLEGVIETDARWAGQNAILPLAYTVHRHNATPVTFTLDPQEVSFLQGGHLDLPNPHVYGDILHLIDCIAENREPLATAKHALHTVEVIDATLRSAETGQVQNVSGDSSDLPLQ